MSKQKKLPMPKSYHYLTHGLRCQIYALKKSGLNQNKIATEIGVSQSTISKEFKRNSGDKNYRHREAHEKALIRRLEASSVKTKKTSNFLSSVKKILGEKISPEKISG